MPYIVSGKQYSGSWTMQQHFQAVAAQTWTNIPGQGVLYSWGDNYSGELGLGDADVSFTDRSSPTQIGSGTTWSKISAAAAIKTDGTLWAWGDNSFGRLGQNNVTNRSSPVQVGSNWSSVSAGSAHTVAIKTDGTLWTWGRNDSGQLGQNIATTIHRSSPVQVGALTNWSLVSTGSDQTLAIKTDGTLWAWGDNSGGCLGLNVTPASSRSSPVQVGSGTTWLSVSAGNSHTAAIKTDGTLWIWGENNNGQLGLGNAGVPRSSPTQVGALTNWSSVSTGYDNTAAIKTDGTLWTWGNNFTYGMLGLGDTANRSSPVQVGSLTNWSSVSAGFQHMVAIKTDGTLWTWGRNSSGQLAQNDLTGRSSPVQVGSLTNWSLVSAGSDWAVAIAKALS